MSQDAERKISRREFLRGSVIAASVLVGSAAIAACAPSGTSPSPAPAKPASPTAPPKTASATPWADPPKSPKPDRLTFVVWQYGNIYDKIVPEFESAWEVKVNPIIEPNVEPMVAKLTSMFAAGEQIDVTQAPFQYLGSFIKQGIVEPIDDLDGVGRYVEDFTPFTRKIAQQQGKTWGLPYFATVWMNIYNEENLKKAGFDAPFRSWDELLEQARKAKRDGVAKYPILWVAGAGFEQLPGTWFVLTYNRGGVIFDRDLKPQLGPGSVARETLAWWQKTFKDELADPKSLEVRFIPAAKAFSTGDYLYLLPLHHYYISLVNDPSQSPIAGKGRHALMPGDGKTLGYTVLYVLSSATKNKEWAWKLLQALGGRTKDGRYTQAERLATDAMLGSGYESVMRSEVVTKGWAKWGDPAIILKQWETAAVWTEAVPAVAEPWYSKWSDAINVELTNCLSGKISADQACDNMIKAVETAKQAR
jgi:ABC-type glycerol-3-phosphate transport system substrate-binding protein